MYFMYSTSVNGPLIATILILWLSIPARKTKRPIRPKPLTPILTAILRAGPWDRSGSAQTENAPAIQSGVGQKCFGCARCLNIVTQTPGHCQRDASTYKNKHMIKCTST